MQAQPHLYRGGAYPMQAQPPRATNVRAPIPIVGQPTNVRLGPIQCSRPTSPPRNPPESSIGVIYPISVDPPDLPRRLGLEIEKAALLEIKGEDGHTPRAGPQAHKCRAII